MWIGRYEELKWIVFRKMEIRYGQHHRGHDHLKNDWMWSLIFIAKRFLVTLRLKHIRWSLISLTIDNDVNHSNRPFRSTHGRTRSIDWVKHEPECRFIESWLWSMSSQWYQKCTITHPHLVYSVDRRTIVVASTRMREGTRWPANRC